LQGEYEVMSNIGPSGFDTDGVAAEVLASLDVGAQIPPLTGRHPQLDLQSAYRVAAAVRRLREARGDRVVGRKIGFTNTTIWAEFNVSAPIWGYVYGSSLHRISHVDGPFDLSRFLEPRIEPEIVFGLARAPEPGMDELELLSCIEWIAHGFEIVQSIFPGWRFTAADTVAAFGLHGALLVGPQVGVQPEEAGQWCEALASFGVTLSRGGEVADEGRAANVLGGGPLAALRHVVDVLAADPESPALSAGEVVTTGTLTRALPVGPGETWTTILTGLPLPGLSLTLV
jgi:2-oxo-3-hexenedioate decarboxylase